jgi:hypothetical protein
MVNTILSPSNNSVKSPGINSSASTTPSQWIRVSDAKITCPICGKPDWCMVSADGQAVICARTESSKRVGEAGYLHLLSDGDRSPGTSYDTPGYSDANSDYTLASASRRHGTYLTLLDYLELSPGHRNNLISRGLPASIIDFNRYRSLPGDGHGQIASMLASQGKVAGVPGFYKGKSGVDLAGPAGLLVPVCNLAQEIIAIQIRRDAYDGQGGKYVWLSSSGRSYGSSPGAPAHVSIPQELTTTDHVFVTEGVLKADIIAYYTGAVVIGIPGVAMWKKAIAVLAELLPLNVILAFDSDRHSNEVVELHYNAFREGILANHFNAYIALWDTSYKGMDDWLCATGGKAQLRLQTLYKATLERPKRASTISYKDALAKSNKTEIEATKPLKRYSDDALARLTAGQAPGTTWSMRSLCLECGTPTMVLTWLDDGSYSCICTTCSWDVSQSKRDRCDTIAGSLKFDKAELYVIAGIEGAN